jgi:hypothetical protein
MFFNNLPDAIRAGFQVYDRTPNGYLVRKMISNNAGQDRWAMAIVDLRRVA